MGSNTRAFTPDAMQIIEIKGDTLPVVIDKLWKHVLTRPDNPILLGVNVDYGSDENLLLTVFFDDVDPQSGR